eukprot:TRINITY_DN6189_c0_g1_i1.p1 TRINITY_DN6189_c0_g1~~TRINITY_DN6189_c0_g1_i1.p1  ORF type:complete len:122 (+),score=11.90 TRINITY_DN6189_c0_g1_i1:45-410(+)
MYRKRPQILQPGQDCISHGKNIRNQVSNAANIFSAAEFALRRQRERLGPPIQAAESSEDHLQINRQQWNRSPVYTAAFRSPSSPTLSYWSGVGGFIGTKRLSPRESLNDEPPSRRRRRLWN